MRLRTKTKNILGQLGFNQLFSIRRGAGKENTVGIDNRRVSAESDSVVRADSIGQDQVTLILNCSRQSQGPQMLDPRKRPGRRVNDYVNAMLNREESARLREAKIVTNR